MEEPSLGGLRPGVEASPVSFLVEEEAGLLPVFVGVSGAFVARPAAGLGILLGVAVVLKLRTVSGVDCLEDLESRLGVGGKL